MAQSDLTIIERLGEEIASTGEFNRVTKLPAIIPPGTTQDSVQKAVAAIKTILDQREGVSGSILDKSLTLRDLIDAGALQINVGGTQLGTVDGNGITFPGTGVPGPQGGQGDPGLPGGGFADPRPILSTPPTLGMFAASGTFRSVVLTWTMTEYQNHSYVEVWRATTNSLGSAALVGTTTANLYVDTAVAPSTTYYYWARAIGISAAGTTLTGAFNATAGTAGGALLVAGSDLGPLVVEAGNLAAMDFSNLVTNPEGRQGISGWGSADAVFAALNDPSTFPFWNGRGLHIMGRDGFFGRVFAVKQNDEFTVSVQAIPDGGGAATYPFFLGFETSNAAGVVTNYVPVVNFPTIGSGVRTATDASFTVPAGVAFLRIWVSIPQAGGGTYGWFFSRSEIRRKPSKLAVNTIVAGDGAIANLAIGNALIQNGAIDDLKVVNVSAAKVTFGEMSGDRIAVGTLQANRITANSITSLQIAANSINADRILANSITAAQIAAGIITANEIAAGAVTAAKINVASLSAITATIGLLRTATTGARMEIASNYIKVFDGSNVKRVQMGDLTA